MSWLRLRSRFLNAVFPRSCELCEAEVLPNLDLCPACFDHFEPVREPFCPRCGEVIEGQVSHARDCPNCRGRRKPYDFARAGFRSHHGSRELVHRFKYARSLHLGRSLAAMAYEAFQADPRLSQVESWVLVPVPLHRQRRRKRGFNQANEIAVQLAKLTGMERLEALKRVRATQTQTKLSRGERQRNLRGAIVVKPRWVDELQGRDVLLIDDVFTTGSTIEECARVIRRRLKPSQIAALTPLRA